MANGSPGMTADRAHELSNLQEASGWIRGTPRKQVYRDNYDNINWKTNAAKGSAPERAK